MDLIKQLNTFMQNIGIDYAICGGHAIDLFLGRKTRPHKDLDVAVYWEDRDEIIGYMLNNNWDIYEPCGMEHLHKINDVNDQKRLRSNIWCVKPSNRHYNFTEHEKDMFAVDFDKSEQNELDYIEFLFNTRKDGDFLYARNQAVMMGLDDAIHVKDNIPYLAPEIILLYKSTAASVVFASQKPASPPDFFPVPDEAEYQLDFDNAIPMMNEWQLKWLINSLTTMFPNGHKWLDVLRQNDRLTEISYQEIDAALLEMIIEKNGEVAKNHIHIEEGSFSLALLNRTYRAFQLNPYSNSGLSALKAAFMFIGAYMTVIPQSLSILKKKMTGGRF